MLEVKDLININYVPLECEISLKLYLQFYEEYLSKKIFIFTLCNGKKLKLFFKGADEIYHISGIEHIYKGIPMKGTRFVELIRNDEIDIVKLRTMNPNVYRDYIDRIRSFACIDAVIKNCEYLWYSDGRIGDSMIKVKYLLLKGLDGINIHLGIDSYKENKPFFAKTLLITKGNLANKFIDKADERIRVSKIEIVEKESDKVIELIDRSTAVQKTKEFLQLELKEWENIYLPQLMNSYLENVASSIKLERKDITEGIFDNEKLKQLKEHVLFYNKESFYEEFGKKFAMQFYADELQYCLDSLKVQFIKCVGSSHVKKYIDLRKSEIRKKIDVYDKYWSGKIVSEQVKIITKFYIKNTLEESIQRLLDMNREDYQNKLFDNLAEANIEIIKGQFVEWILDTPVREDIYEYIISE